MREFVDYGVLGILGFLSVVMLGLVLERWWFYKGLELKDFDDKRILELELHKRLTLIATIASNAPYIGLLGTVAGIMVTFLEIGTNSLVDAQSIMSGLALALKATAAGLLVAIPCIVFYNLLLRRAEVILSLWEIAHHPLDPLKASMRVDMRANPEINIRYDV